jgi:cbb3-type cytochrome oxidase cytochrome c subunit
MSSDETFYNLKRLHLVFAVSSLALLAATLWMLAADHRREWKVYQRTFRDQVEPSLTEAELREAEADNDTATVETLRWTLTSQQPSLAKRLLRLPLVDAFGRPLTIQQIWLPGLTINYNFRQVARFDRCTTCHLGLDKTSPGSRGLPQPYCSHPRLDLFVGTGSPHPASEFGCTICHAGQGSATAFKFASHTPNDPEERGRWQKQHGWFWNQAWDFPMKPSRFAESSCLRCHHDVVDLEPTRRFTDPPAPKLLAGYQLVRQNGCFGCHEIKGIGEFGERLGPDMRLEPNDLAAAEGISPGTMRKVGPSLRNLAGRLDRAFLLDWNRQPSRFRPETRMPQFFAQYEHLEGQSLADTKRLEAVEVHAVTDYLLAASQPIAGASEPEGVMGPPSIERGKRLFELRGCLACHKHKDFPEGQATQGPDLSNLGAKLNTPAGATWLVRWLRDPVSHSPRTFMPNPELEPEAPMTDPAADLAAYLLSSYEWQPKEYPTLVEADLDELALLHLTKSYPKDVAKEYLQEGIPASAAAQAEGDARELVGPITREKKLRYVGRRTIRKRGCYGCHDIPGFENAPLIGPALSDWGRKQESQLAFEQVHQLLAKEEADRPVDNPDTAFFQEAVLTKRREGFIWQKLRAPRSFDYKIAEKRGFNGQLLMGRFNMTAEQREAVITFVLGLVAEPPAKKYIPQPDRRRQAIVEGRKVLDKYGCALCHTLEMERWAFQYDPKKFEGPAATDDFPFLTPPFAAKELKASARSDRRGMGRAEVVGMPRVDAKGKLLVAEGDEEDQQGEPLPLVSFTLWEPAAINGQVWRVGGADLLLYQHQLLGKRAPWGGDFARLLYPKALADAKASGTTASEVEAWGWGPPALVHEGAMVQPAWLYQYLLAPSVIRPAAVLRMPRFNLSTAEAGKLVDYFAATAGVEFPYHLDPRSRAASLANLDARQTERLDKALRLVTDRTTYCAKCHLIGDFSPGGENRTILAPNLDQVSRRIRSEYVRRWLANPRTVLPYTAMPVNFPPTGEPMGQDLFPGSSLEQLEAVTDLLLGYDDYLKARTSIRAVIEKRPAAEPYPAQGPK